MAYALGRHPSWRGFRVAAATACAGMILPGVGEAMGSRSSNGLG